MSKRSWLYVLCSVLMCLPATTDAGLFSWLFGRTARQKYERDTGSNLTTRARLTVAALRDKASLEQKTAIQIGEIHSSVTQMAQDKQWFGNVSVDVKANYTATYGLPYDLIEKGIRVEKDYSTTGLVVIVAAPIPLSVAVDTHSVYIADRGRSGLRTWKEVPHLQIEAQRWLTSRATEDARERCSHADALNMTREVVRDIVLDMAGDIYSAKLKRVLAPRTTVVFEDELDLANVKSRTQPPTTQ